MTNEDESLDRYTRLLRMYPVGNLSAAGLEEWVATVLQSVGSQEGVSDLVVQMQERIQGVDGNFDLDATVRFRVLGFDFLALVEVKQHRHPIKRELVQVLHSKIQSVGAHKGIMFSTAHFQSGALEYARVHGIALVFVTEGRLTIERRSANELPPMSAEQAEEWGIDPIAGTYFGAGESEGSVASAYIGPDRPDLVWSFLLAAGADQGRPM